MSVSRETMAAFRFGYGFRPGQAVSSDPDALLSQIKTAAKEPPLFAKDKPVERAALFEKGIQAARRVRRAKTDDARKEATEERNRLRLDFRRLIVDDMHARIAQPMISPHGFYERLAYFWTNHFAISLSRLAVRAAGSFHERDAIRPYIGGRFRDLFGAAVTHPAMLFFLDQNSSIGPNSQRGRKTSKGLNENLAREILELHTLGVKGGYSQADVTEFAKLLTGLRYNKKRRTVGYQNNAAEPGRHTVLGAGYGAAGRVAGRKEIERAFDAIAAHPSTAKHICGKLARHFVSDKPSGPLVDAMVAAWTRSDGDLPSVYRALLTHKDSWSSFGDKVKLPFDYIVSGLRAVDAPARAIGRPKRLRPNPYSLGALEQLNQRPWFPKGPDGYPDDNASWLTPQGLATRLEWAALLGRRVEDRIDPRKMMDVALADLARPDTKFVVAGAAERWEGIALVLASPEFNRR